MAEPGWARRAVQSRFLRGVAVGVLVTLLSLTLVVSYVWSLALSDACDELQRADLSIDELVAVKRRVDAYRRDPSAALELTGREASFLLREQWRYPVFVELEGDLLQVQATVEEGNGCYNVDFRGKVEVEDGVATVAPTGLVVGDLDLTRWSRGRSFEVRPTQLSSDHASFLLDQTTHMHVDGSRMAVQVQDPKALK